MQKLVPSRVWQRSKSNNIGLSKPRLGEWEWKLSVLSWEMGKPVMWLQSDHFLWTVCLVRLGIYGIFVQNWDPGVDLVSPCDIQKGATSKRQVLGGEADPSESRDRRKHSSPNRSPAVGTPSWLSQKIVHSGQSPIICPKVKIGLVKAETETWEESEPDPFSFYQTP